MPTRFGGAALALTLLGCQEASYRALPNHVTVTKPGDFVITLQGRKPAPNLVLVVDRSVGMLASASGAGPGCADALGHYTGDRTQDCKWNRTLDLLVGTASQPGLVEQLNTTLSTPHEPLGLGLVFFPGDDTNACTPGRPTVGLTDDGVESLTQALLAARPAGAPSAAETIIGLADVFPTETYPRDRDVLLVTGSTPGCAGDDALVNSVAALHENNGVAVLVLGVNPDPGVATDALQHAAVAGGFPRAGTPTYFTSSEPAELLAELRPFPTGWSRCEYRLQGPVADPALLEITVKATDLPATQLTAEQYALSDDRITVEIVDAALCRHLNESALDEPSTIEFRYLSL